jgi:hypothetical protein
MVTSKPNDAAPVGPHRSWGSKNTTRIIISHHYRQAINVH